MNTEQRHETVATKTAPLSTVLHEGGVELKQTLGHMAQDGKLAVGQMLEDGKSRVGELVDEGRSRAADWKGEVGAAVRARPIQSLLIALGVGSVLGLLLRGRSA